MNDQLREIGERLSALRKIFEYTPAFMAEKLGVTEEQYISYENGKCDFSFSFLYNAAEILEVDVMDLMSGDSPKLSYCTVVRNGEGYEIQRRKAYSYRHLAFTFRKKKAEPFLVTVDPNTKNKTAHAHEGQEFNYIISGSIRLFIGEETYDLNKGDSVYFDSGIPHRLEALGNKSAQFIAVVIK